MRRGDRDMMLQGRYLRFAAFRYCDYLLTSASAGLLITTSKYYSKVLLPTHFGGSKDLLHNVIVHKSKC